MSAEAAVTDKSAGHGHGVEHEHGDGSVLPNYPVAHHFDTADQQHEAAMLGMWSFLATEVLFFGGLILAYAVYRATSPVQFTLASHHLNVPLGAVNTAVLLVSSLCAALAVRAAQLQDYRQVIRLLIVTMVLGAAFLGVKAVEWTTDYREGLVPFASNFQIPAEDMQAMVTKYNLPTDAAVLKRYQMFWVLYFFMTGLHAAHMIIGLVAVSSVCYLVYRKRHTGGYVNMVEVMGLYWHFIDIVWVFLYPLLYLIDPRTKGH